MKALSIAATDLRRLVRWRANIFFLFVLPMMIILLLGAAFGGTVQARIGVIDHDGSRLSRQFIVALDARPSVALHSYSNAAALEHAVARGDVDAGLIIPARYGARLQQGQDVSLDYLGRPDSVAQQVRATVQTVAGEQSVDITAAQILHERSGIGFGAALARARAAAARIPRVVVALTAPGGAPYTTASDRFETGASTQLLLFIFLNSLSGATFMIETRRLGIARRILSTPTSSATMLLGVMLGRLAIALIQALIIVLGTILLFGVSWGDPLGTATLILSFSLVSSGAAMLIGSLFATEAQAQPVSLLLGLGLAALGGSMVPLEVFPNSAREIAHITPHAWANDAFAKLLKHGGDLATILPQIGVLLAFAAALVTLAAFQLRRTLTH